MRLRTLAAAVALASAAPAAPAERIALFPFEDWSGARGAREGAMPAVAAALARMGWEIVPADRVEAALEARRVRWLASPPRDALAAALRDVGAERAVLGVILAWSPGRNPAVGLAARLVTAAGDEPWADEVGLDGEAGAGLLGAGRTRQIAKVARRAADRLFETLPGPGARAPERRPSPPRKLRTGDLPRPAIPLDAIRGVCILPLDDEGAGGRGARIVGELLGRRLRHDAGLPVVGAAELRDAIAAERIRTLHGADADALRRLARRAGADVVVTGTVYRFADDAVAGGAGDPTVEIHLALARVDDGRLLWSAHLARRGSEYRGFLQMGGIGDRVSLADQAAAEIAAALRPRRKERP